MKNEQEKKKNGEEKTPCGLKLEGECGGSSSIGSACYTCLLYNPERDGRLDNEEEEQDYDYDGEEEEEEEIEDSLEKLKEERTKIKTKIRNTLKRVHVLKDKIESLQKKYEELDHKIEDIKKEEWKKSNHKIEQNIKKMVKFQKQIRGETVEEEEEEGPLNPKTISRLTGEQLRKLPIGGVLK